MAVATAFVPGSATNLVQEIELTIKAKNLADKDALSLSDPMCVVWIRRGLQTEWTEVGRTEVIQNTLNPEFATKIRIGYLFEEQQPLKFTVYDIDNAMASLSSHDFLGEAQSTLAQIVSNGSIDVELKEHSGAKSGRARLIVTALDASEDNQFVDLDICGRKLAKSGMFSLPDPFLSFYRVSSDGREPLLVHRTAPVRDSRDPSWPLFSLPLRWLQEGGRDVPLLIRCYNHNRNGTENETTSRHKLMGEVTTTVSDLLKVPDMIALGGGAGKKAGHLCVKSAKLRHQHSFLDYVSGGTQLHCTFAIDFTASNGACNNPASLHFLGGGGPTQYETALRAVGSVVQDYDSDKQFPVLGFGARLPPDGRLSHEFFVNMTQSPFCSGIDGVLHAYRQCLHQVQMYGPTNFAPVIDHVARFASSYLDGGHYFILLILTDGAICDMAETKRAIVQASTLPMSIIIVGIGNADFGPMNELDGDDAALTSGGRRAARDIVQFVAFRDFTQKAGINAQHSAFELARAVLQEIPQQLVSFMTANEKKPPNRR